MKNNYKEKILSYARSLGLDAVGVAADGHTYSKIVCLFPYYVGQNQESNISMYAYAPDYHKIVRDYLIRIAAYVQSLQPSAKTELYADTGHGDDRRAAFEAGLGFYGKNGLLIHPRYGSFVFIGYVETDLLLESDVPLSMSCSNCGKCAEICPGQAFEQGTFYVTRCASHISQKRGMLTLSETAILEKSGLIWGCDACQTVCPHNQLIPKTPLLPFRTNLSYKVKPIHLSNKEFKTSFGDRAYAWRGKQVINRNLEILSSHNKTDDDHNK